MKKRNSSRYNEAGKVQEYDSYRTEEQELFDDFEEDAESVDEKDEVIERPEADLTITADDVITIKNGKCHFNEDKFRKAGIKVQLFALVKYEINFGLDNSDIRMAMLGILAEQSVNPNHNARYCFDEASPIGRVVANRYRKCRTTKMRAPEGLFDDLMTLVFSAIQEGTMWYSPNPLDEMTDEEKAAVLKSNLLSKVGNYVSYNGSKTGRKTVSDLFDVHCTGCESDEDEEGVESADSSNESDEDKDGKKKYAVSVRNSTYTIGEDGGELNLVEKFGAIMTGKLPEIPDIRLLPDNAEALAEAISAYVNVACRRWDVDIKDYAESLKEDESGATYKKVTDAIKYARNDVRVIAEKLYAMKKIPEVVRDQVILACDSWSPTGYSRCLTKQFTAVVDESVKSGVIDAANLPVDVAFALSAAMAYESDAKTAEDKKKAADAMDYVKKLIKKHVKTATKAQPHLFTDIIIPSLQIQYAD